MAEHRTEDIPTHLESRPSGLCPGVTVYADGTLVGTRGHVLRPAPNGSKGYQIVTRRIDGRLRSFNLHTIVCEAFHGPKPTPEHQVRHLNGKAEDCSAANLCWGTVLENAADREAHGTTVRGEQHPSAKLTVDQVLEIRALAAEGVPQRTIAADYGIGQGHVSAIHRRHLWAHLDDAGNDTTLAEAA